MAARFPNSVQKNAQDCRKLFKYYWPVLVTVSPHLVAAPFFFIHSSSNTFCYSLHQGWIYNRCKLCMREVGIFFSFVANINIKQSYFKNLILNKWLHTSYQTLELVA